MPTVALPKSSKQFPAGFRGVFREGEDGKSRVTVVVLPGAEPVTVSQPVIDHLESTYPKAFITKK